MTNEQAIAEFRAEHPECEIGFSVINMLLSMDTETTLKFAEWCVAKGYADKSAIKKIKAAMARAVASMKPEIN